MFDLNEIERLAKAATPGKWYRTTVFKHPSERQLIRSRFDEPSGGRSDLAVAECWGANGPNEADAEFIAHMHPARTLALVERVRELEADCSSHKKTWVERVDACIALTEQRDRLRSLLDEVRGYSPFFPKSLVARIREALEWLTPS